MKLRVWLASGVFILSAAAVLFSQDLAEAAKKERERRAAFKNKPVTLLTNDKISGITKKPAVGTSEEAFPLGEEEYAPPVGEREPVDYEVSPTLTVPSVTVIQPTERFAASGETSDAGQASDAETSWKKAKEYADLLETKLNSLWLQFYSMDDGMPRELLQQEIADVFEKYTRAREEETRLRETAGVKKSDNF